MPVSLSLPTLKTSGGGLIHCGPVALGTTWRYQIYQIYQIYQATTGTATFCQ